MNSRQIKNLMHATGTLLAVLLYFSGFFQGDGNFKVALALIFVYIILGRITSELAYRVDRKLLEEKIRR